MTLILHSILEAIFNPEFKKSGKSGSARLSRRMTTVASEKNREMLFIGNVFYKQWHLYVLFH